jgi:transcriptional accessory protein Tex/SPT6
MHALDHLSAFDVLLDSLINSLHVELDKVLCRSPYYPKATANVDPAQIEESEVAVKQEKRSSIMEPLWHLF